MKPMLAISSEKVEIQFPCIVQPKLDGVRALVKDGIVYSRKLLPIPNKHVQKLFGHLHGFDGELMCGDFNQTQSAVMSEEGEPNVEFWVFDLWERVMPFTDINSSQSENVIITPTSTVHDEHNLQLAYAEYLKAGYEGMMVRNPNAPYKFGRAGKRNWELIKYKPMQDSEFEIVGYTERMHNSNKQERDEVGNAKRSSAKAGMVPTGTLGAWVCKIGELTFEVGTGFDEQQRLVYWLNRESFIGKLAKVKFQEIGSKGRPRFPVFLGIRDERDMS